MKGRLVLTLEETIQLILKNTDHDRKQILQFIEEKRQELGPEVVNDESAAMIVARELGIDLHQLTPRARTRIEDITEATRNVVLTARVVRVDPVRTFPRTGGGDGKVASIILADETGQIRVALWDEMTRPVEEEAISIGDAVQIRGAYVKKGLRDTLELNLGRMGGIRKLQEEDLEDIEVPMPAPAASGIANLQMRSYDVTLTFKVLRVFGVSTFTRSSDGTQGKVMSIIGGDETGSSRIVFWDTHVEQMDGVQEGEVIKLTGAYTKEGRNGELEIHAGRSSTIQRGLKQKIDAVELKRPMPTIQPLGKVAIAQLSTEMRDVDIEGKVVSIAEIKTFEKGSKKGRLRSTVVGDESGSTRVTFWNDDVDKIDRLREGDTVRIKHAYVKEGFRGGVEIHIGQRGEIEINPGDLNLESLDLSQLQTTPSFRPVRLRISDIDESIVNKGVEISGMIVAVQDSSPFYLSYTCTVHGGVKKPVPLLLYKVTLDDGSGNTTRVTAFDAVGQKLLGMTAEEMQKAAEKMPGNPLDRLKGDYFTVRGIVKKFRDSIEISAREVLKSDILDEIRQTRDEVEGLLEEKR
jgi:replication factor A1